ncbi:uncharacterized protein METZ01_LOCUS78072 [marine metagenome]|uniref:Uncharacterized protein n=1 Tax=marine metagenome TaxID=408172 RepID=A0A381UC85_9ZZZZ
MPMHLGDRRNDFSDGIPEIGSIIDEMF